MTNIYIQGNFGANSVFSLNCDKIRALRFMENTASHTPFIKYNHHLL
jgi:hypothetical protein